ncbi:MAG: DMT family transporter [Dysgonomonadaceae bacterium]|jgi:drug/metabolite transporter (DMT)-like permease|nr:DMT family transporter [Dysgonamonadaceae bacterium]HOV35817.1 DMT family transporter [Dysgonamonadaceae bacterium]HQG08818.1 DMT family transporter [Dysgonamonadaceae bacterium]HQI42578.1 DMT family transporter [Dysgonamonadaceae bacterium]
MTKTNQAMLYAFVAACLYALSTPFSKLLLEKIPPTFMAAFLYLGAGIGMFLTGKVKKRFEMSNNELDLNKKDSPYVIAMIVLDILAPVFLMIGLNQTTASNAALLNNFEIVATALFARSFFRESISNRLWFAIFLITLATMILSVEDSDSFSFSVGSLFVVVATICGGIENNCTRVLSVKNPLQIVVCIGNGSFTDSVVLRKISDIRMAIPLAGLSIGFCSVRTQYLLLCICTKRVGRGENECLLCCCSFCGSSLFAPYLT